LFRSNFCGRTLSSTRMLIGFSKSGFGAVNLLAALRKAEAKP
jgi:hypothetical protein